MVATDYYAVLGVARSASDGEIKAAYRALALRYHPDRNPGDDDAEARFKQLSEAYAVLSDPERRMRFDRFGAVAGDVPFGADELANATEFFDAVFGDLFGRGRKRRAGRDLRYTLELELEEAALGCDKTIRFPRDEDCSACAGTGAEGGRVGLETCATCAGKGVLRAKTGFLPVRRDCVVCDGTGQVPKRPCATCGGRGLVERERSYDVRVPAGSVRGATQRVPGEGAPARRGGTKGDLHVVVRVRPHPYYREEEGVLVCDVPLTMIEAAVGSELEVPVLDGTVLMKVPAGTQPGAVFRIKGRGLPRGATGERGDVHVRLNVEVPAALPDAARIALEAAADALGPDAHPKRRAFEQERAKRKSAR